MTGPEAEVDLGALHHDDEGAGLHPEAATPVVLDDVDLTEGGAHHGVAIVANAGLHFRQR